MIDQTRPADGSMVRAKAREGDRFYCGPAQVSSYFIKLVACLKLEAGNLTSGPASARSQPIERSRALHFTPARLGFRCFRTAPSELPLYIVRATGSESHGSLHDRREGIVGNVENSFRPGTQARANRRTNDTLSAGRAGRRGERGGYYATSETLSSVF